MSLSSGFLKVYKSFRKVPSTVYESFQTGLRPHCRVEGPGASVIGVTVMAKLALLHQLLKRGLYTPTRSLEYQPNFM